VLVAALQAAIQTPPSKVVQPTKDWYAAALTDLINHILEVHHAYMHKALPKVTDLLKKVLRAHGPRHGTMLSQVQDVFAALDGELTPHLAKEETVLFPYMVAADAHARGQGPKPVACFPTVRAPIQQMEREHEEAGRALERLRELTGDYALPEDACPTFVALYAELQRMEADLHQHIHLENNILFPRAIEMEGAAWRRSP
jgi:regulator of cell morphogenesis and NO signaling